MAKIHYKKLGLVNTQEMFQKAMAGHYAVPAYNFNNLEQLEAIIIGSSSRSPPSSSSVQAAPANT